MSTSNEIAQSRAEIAVKLNTAIGSVIGQKNLLGFQKAFVLSDAIVQLREALSPEYMKPIMALQGNRLGFKTDKDKETGYPENIVKNCLIEAVMFGLQPVGNQFNIIGGNMYATQEGVKYLLDNYPELWYDVSFGRIDAELPNYQTAINCDVVTSIHWKVGKEALESIHSVTFQIKANKGMNIDAVIGKAKRKAYKWLHDKVTGNPIPDTDDATTFTEHTVESSVTHKPKAGEQKSMFTATSTVIKEDLKELFDLKKASLKESELKRGNEILEKNDVASFDAFHTFLKGK